jgi:DNA-directed RNA polymerase specialized sigma subunit
MSLSHPTKKAVLEEKARRIVALVLKEPELQRSVIARRFGVSDAFVSDTLKRCGLFVPRINGRLELL